MNVHMRVHILRAFITYLLVHIHQKQKITQEITVKMDLFHNEQNFDLDKSRQKFHHSLKEHHKINNIPKFRCEML